MSLQIHAWEAPLLSWAHYALENAVAVDLVSAAECLLREAYRACEDITRFHSRTFSLASGLLPPDKRLAVRALYAFCRVTDDIVDEPNAGNRLKGLEEWQREALGPVPTTAQPVALAWADTRVRFGIPHGYAEQLICGVSRDLIQTRYPTFAELAAYAYGVASTVGLMVMHIIGYQDADAIPYAIKLGVALQLTNILRDIGEDWRQGRLYLPQEELDAFGVSEEVVTHGRVTPQQRELMRFQVERNRRLYDEALPGIRLLNADGRFAIAASAGLYRAILLDIERHDYDVFSRRAHVGTLGKLRRLPALWWMSNSTAGSSDAL